MDTSLDERVRFLQSVKTDEIAHSERALLGTRQIPVDWGARPALCDAGLFHSVYGTEHFVPTPAELSRRPEIQRLIGPGAEQLAWLFCIMRRDSFDENLNRAVDFGVRGPPETYVVDQNGIIVEKVWGKVGPGQLEDAIARLTRLPAGSGG